MSANEREYGSSWNREQLTASAILREQVVKLFPERKTATLQYDLPESIHPPDTPYHGVTHTVISNKLPYHEDYKIIDTYTPLFEDSDAPTQEYVLQFRRGGAYIAQNCVYDGKEVVMSRKITAYDGVMESLIARFTALEAPKPGRIARAKRALGRFALNLDHLPRLM